MISHAWLMDGGRLDNNNVDILAFAVEEEVAHPAADYVAVDAELVGFFANELENGILYFRICDYHEGSTITSNSKDQEWSTITNNYQQFANEGV
jgi:hypothetical protein